MTSEEYLPTLLTNGNSLSSPSFQAPLSSYFPAWLILLSSQRSQESLTCSMLLLPHFLEFHLLSTSPYAGGLEETLPPTNRSIIPTSPMVLCLYLKFSMGSASLTSQWTSLEENPPGFGTRHMVAHSRQQLLTECLLS